MAFFKNYEKKVNAGYDLNEEAGDNEMEEAYGSRGNDNMDASSSEKDALTKPDDQYPSEEEPSNAGRELQNETSDRNVIGNMGRRTALVGKWGSSFWKDCQPMWESKDGGDSDYKKSEEKYEGNSSDDYDGEENGEDVQRGQADVPADEMLSDEYYEQDGEEQSDSLHYRETRRPSTSGSRLPPKPVAKKNLSRSSKAAKCDEFEYDDDYEDEDEEEEDDPDDADFEPDFVELNSATKNKCKGSESDDLEDDDDAGDADDDIDVSDEDDTEYNNNRRRSIRHKAGRNSRPTRESKSISVHNRRKRGRTFSSDEESSAKDSEEDFNEDFNHRAKRSSQSHKKSTVRSTANANPTTHGSELRTSSRAVRKVSYVESEESEEIEEGKSNKSHKVSQEDAEEDDGDSIEKVLWHQPKGIAEEALRNNKSIQPVVMSTMLDSELDWNDMELFIKWKGQSHLHCQWKSFSDLQNLTGFKKVLNYIKRVTEESKFKKALSREEVHLMCIWSHGMLIFLSSWILERTMERKNIGQGIYFMPSGFLTSS